MDSEVIALRPRLTSMPHDADPERALIALCVCHGGEAFDVAQELGLRGGDFSRENLKAIWQAVWRLRADSKHVDDVTVVAELKRAGHLEAVGGAAVVTQLRAQAVHAGAAETYARLVREGAALRRLTDVCRIIADDANTARAPAAELLAEAQRALVKLAARDSRGEKLEPLVKARQELALHGVGSDETPQTLTFSCAADLAHKTFPATPWLVRGVLTQRSLTVVGGEPKTTKTWAALELGMALATGTRAFGELPTAVEPAPVALFMAEDSEQSLRNRLRALAASRGLSMERACKRLYHRNLTPLDITKEEDLARFVAGVRDLPEQPVAVILDPLRDLHTADENDSTAMSKVMHSLRALRGVLGCAVIFVHHASKATESSKNRRPGQRMRGSSVVHGAVDGGLYLVDLSGNLETEWTNTAHAEVKAARSAGTFSLTLTVDDDDAGEAVKAKWTYGESETKAAAMSEADLVVAALTDLNDRTPAGYHSTTAIRELTGKRQQTISRVLYELLAGRVVERSSRGGWRIASAVTSTFGEVT